MTLEDVGPDNWRHCAALELEEPQRPFVAPVPYYLALCAYDEAHGARSRCGSPMRSSVGSAAACGPAGCRYHLHSRPITVVFARRHPGVDCDGSACRAMSFPPGSVRPLNRPDRLRRPHAGKTAHPE